MVRLQQQQKGDIWESTMVPVYQLIPEGPQSLI